MLRHKSELFDYHYTVCVLEKERDQQNLMLLAEQNQF